MDSLFRALLDRARPIVIVFALVPIAAGIDLQGAPQASGRALTSISSGRLFFRPNAGLAGPTARFVARGDGYDAELADGEMLLRLRSETGLEAAVRLRFEGGAAPAVPEAEQPFLLNLFIGDDSRSWIRGASAYTRIRYRNVFEGVDAIFYGNGRELEYDLVLGEGVPLDSVRLRVDGADAIELNPFGDVALSTPAGTILMRRPLAYQDAEGGERIPVNSGYTVTENEVAFWAERPDATRALIVDPVFTLPAPLGGGLEDSSSAVAVDSNGNAYVTGRTASANFPTLSPAQPNKQEGMDAFVSKVGADGQLVYSTYFGGAGDDAGLDIDVDTLGNAYISGSTTSSNLPGVTVPGSANAGGQDGFIAKIDSSGNLGIVRYLGGSGDDTAEKLTVDPPGNIYVAGSTKSPNFGRSLPFTPLENDAYVAKVNSSGALQFVTVFGGSGADEAHAIALDPVGVMHVAGGTRSSDFPLNGTLQPYGGASDCFVSRFNAAGTMTYASYLGGAADDVCRGIAVGSAGVYVAGGTSSSNFPTVLPAQPANGGGEDAFVVRFNSPGTSVVYSTYVGGSGDDSTNSLAIDALGAVFAAGTTTSPNFPNVNAYQPASQGAIEAFTVKIGASGVLAAASYLGGSSEDLGNGIALDANTNVFVAGSTSSNDFPAGAPQPIPSAGGLDGFLVRIPESEFRPRNDDFEDAITLTGTTGATAGTNVGATFQPKEVVVAGGGSTTVWWRWTAPFTGTATIDTTGSGLDTILGIFTGIDLGSLTLVASDNDSGGGGTSRATFPATGGTTYFVSVNGFSSAVGPISLQWVLRPPVLTGGVAIQGFAAAVPGGTQQGATIALSNPYPLPISGQLTITFAPDIGLAVDDPALQFTSGGRTANFTIPAGSTQAVFADNSGAASFQTGTVAGVITLRATLESMGEVITPTPPQSVTTVSRQAPVVSAVTINNVSSTSFEIVITGHSTPREITQAVFTFAGVPGVSLTSSTIQVDLSAVFVAWYQNSVSAQFGSRFRLVIPFTVQGGGRSSLGGVGVALVNSLGASSAVTATFQ